MSLDLETFYRLLPAIYRIRDAGNAIDGDPPLQALLAVIQEQIAVLEEDIAQLYDDQFIETCRDWVVPYIGALIGVRGISPLPQARYSPRAFVANTIGYRRRKGTLVALEQVARDASGWPVKGVEYFQRLAVTQYMDHVRPDSLAFANLRDRTALHRIGSAFESTTHTAELRRIETGGGRYNIPNIGLFVWRLNSYRLAAVPAARLDDVRFHFDPVGRDIQLFTAPAPRALFVPAFGEPDVPMPIGRELLRRALPALYGPDLAIMLRVNGKDVPRSEVGAADLSDLHDGLGQVIGWDNMPREKVAIDPVLGRIALPPGMAAPQRIETDHAYGFGADIGGGPYPRAASFVPDPVKVIEVPHDQPDLASALAALSVTGGAIEIKDNAIHPAPPTITVPAGKMLEIRAAEKWRPVLLLSSPLELRGGDESVLLLNGFLLDGGWTIRVPEGGGNALHRLALRHLTAMPGMGGAVEVGLAGCQLEVTASIIGGLAVIETASATISNSIVDCGSATGTAYSGPDGAAPGAPLSIERSTVTGTMGCRMMTLASNCIFDANLAPGDTWPAAVWADRLQTGCVRYCYLPVGARLPETYRCVIGSPTPVFTTRHPERAAYCRLSELSGALLTAAENGTEPGVFNSQSEPQRLTALEAAVADNLRLGLEAGMIEAS